MPLPASTWIDVDAVEDAMLAVLKHRLAQLGADGSGLGPYYAARVQAGEALNPGDRMLLKLLATDFLDFDHVVEAGAGFGQLGLALAAGGRQVWLVEAAAERVACIEALKTALSLKFPAIASNATVVHGHWPAEPSGVKLSRALLVAVDFVFTASEEEASRAMEALTWYAGAMIDGAHFIESRLTPERCAEFYDELQYRGLSSPVPLPPHANTRNSHFVFTAPHARDARPQHARHFIE